MSRSETKSGLAGKPNALFGLCIAVLAASFAIHSSCTLLIAPPASKSVQPDCKSDSDCSDEEPYCIDRECMECKSDEDCKRDGERCLREQLRLGEGNSTFVNVCAKCVTRHDCPGRNYCESQMRCKVTTRECTGAETGECTDIYDVGTRDSTVVEDAADM